MARGCDPSAPARARPVTASDPSSQVADTGPVTHEGTTDARPPSGRRRSVGLALGAAVWAGASVLAFLELDPIIAAFLVILAGTAVVIAAVARDWDRHPSFEERELARARKRAAKWERNKDVRARDRARWEAHQARRAKKSAG